MGLPPCPVCGNMLWVQMVLHARPLGSFSLSGSTMKVSAYEWPHLRCAGCDLDVPASDRGSDPSGDVGHPSDDQEGST